MKTNTKMSTSKMISETLTSYLPKLKRENELLKDALTKICECYSDSMGLKLIENAKELLNKIKNENNKDV